MADDFMSEISSAVEAASTPAQTTAPASVTTNVTPAQEVSNAVNSKSVNSADDVYADLEKSFGIEETSKTSTDTEKSADEVVVAAKDDSKVKAKTDPKQAEKGKASARYLDTFLKEDAQGNFINAAGEVIATAGKSREHLEGLKREGRAYRDAANRTAMSNLQLAEKFKELYTEYNAVKESKSSFDWKTNTGFNDREASEAVNLMKEYKKDPINAIKMLLTSAKMNGIDVSKIGANISADPASMKAMMQEMIEEKIAPLSRSAEQDHRQRAAQQEVQRFYAKYPDAQDYEDKIIAAKQQFPQMPLEEIWLRFENALIKQQSSQQRPRLSLKERFSSNRPQAKSLQRTVTMPQAPDFTKMSFREIAELTEKELNNG